MVQAVALGSEAIGSMCRSIAAWAEEVGKPKQHAEPEDLQPIVDSIQVRHSHAEQTAHTFWATVNVQHTVFGVQLATSESSGVLPCI